MSEEYVHLENDGKILLVDENGEEMKNAGVELDQPIGFAGDVQHEMIRILSDDDHSCSSNSCSSNE